MVHYLKLAPSILAKLIVWLSTWWLLACLLMACAEDNFAMARAIEMRAHLALAPSIGHTSETAFAQEWGPPDVSQTFDGYDYWTYMRDDGIRTERRATVFIGHVAIQKASNSYRRYTKTILIFKDKILVKDIIEARR